MVRPGTVVDRNIIYLCVRPTSIIADKIATDVQPFPTKFSIHK